MVSCTDPAAVNQTLQSLDEGMDDEATAAVFDELRKVPAEVTVIAEASHQEWKDRGEDRTLETVIDHRERANFPYASWKDVSGRAAGLDQYKVAAVEVVPRISSADAETRASLKSLTDKLLDICRRYRHGGGDVKSYQAIRLNHPKGLTVNGSRVFVTSSAGENAPWWMGKANYTACRFLWPGLGAIYRLLVFKSLANLRYTITKSISVKRQDGAGWQNV